jgi:hypothetical protein
VASVARLTVRARRRGAPHALRRLKQVIGTDALLVRDTRDVGCHFRREIIPGRLVQRLAAIAGFRELLLQFALKLSGGSGARQHILPPEQPARGRYAALLRQRARACVRVGVPLWEL